MKNRLKKELDLIELGVLINDKEKKADQLENAVIFTWLNDIKPEWKAISDIKFDLSEFEDWI
jgi:hypothetical protein